MRPDMHINDASTASGLSPRMIRHYEKLGLIRAVGRREKGHRLYTEADLLRLRFVAAARDLGFELNEIRDYLALWEDQNRPGVEIVQEALATVHQLNKKIAAVEVMRASFLDLARRCQSADRPQAPAIDNALEAARF